MERKDFSHVVGMVLFLFALGFLVGHLMGCRPAHLGATAAESAYTAELLRCVDEAETLSESRACRERVDSRWGITETVRKDSGR